VEAGEAVVAIVHLLVLGSSLLRYPNQKSTTSAVLVRLMKTPARPAAFSYGL
jgi:hypothetical protein